MDSRTGKRIRLSRLKEPTSDKYFVVAYSHGVLLGPSRGMMTLAGMRSFVSSINSVPAVMITPGLVTQMEDCFIGVNRPSLVIHLDWQNHSRAILPYREGASAQLADIDRVVAAGADCVMTYLYVGHEDVREERQEIERNARIVNMAERYGLPVMIEPRSAREKSIPADKTDPELMAMYCRLSAEIGADLVKCIYPGTTEAMQQIVETCPAPLLVAGGAKKSDEDQAGLDIAQSALDAGAAGLVFGRNIYQADAPQKVIDQINSLLHGHEG